MRMSRPTRMDDGWIAKMLLELRLRYTSQFTFDHLCLLEYSVQIRKRSLYIRFYYHVLAIYTGKKPGSAAAVAPICMAGDARDQTGRSG